MRRLALAIASVLALGLAGCDHEVCVRSHYETQTTYPYMGFAAMGGSYALMAMVPVTSNVEVCDEYQTIKSN